MVSSHPKNNESNDTRQTTYWAKTEHQPLPSVPQGCMVLHIGLGSSRTQRWYLSTIGWFSYGSETFVWAESFLDTRHWATHSHLEFRMNSQGSQLLQGWSAKALEAQGQSQDRPRDKCQSEAQRQQLESSAPVSEGLEEMIAMAVRDQFYQFQAAHRFVGSFPPLSHPGHIFCGRLAAMLFIPSSRGVYNHDKNKTHDISWHMAVCQNLVPLVNIKIAGIYGCE